jgi:hypothetical protein
MTNNTTNNLPVLYVPSDAKFLPDVDKNWQYRIGVKSSSSNALHVVSQNVNRGHWGCSCPGYRIHRKCKHLASMALPAGEKPYHVVVTNHPSQNAKQTLRLT